MSTFTSITLQFAEAVAAFNAVAVHAAGKNEVTKVVTGIHITPEGNLVATDRYTVGYYKPAYQSNNHMRPRLEGDEFAGATLPPEAVKWVTAMRATKLATGGFSWPMLTKIVTMRAMSTAMLVMDAPRRDARVSTMSR